MCKTRAEYDTSMDSNETTETALNSPTQITPSRPDRSYTRYSLFDDSDLDDDVEVEICGCVVDLVSLKDNLDEDGEVAQKLEEQWEKVTRELQSTRSEVDRVLLCLREHGRKWGRSENTAQKRNAKTELTGLLDGMASMRCAKRRRL